MKKILTIILILLSTSVFSQTITDFVEATDYVNTESFKLDGEDLYLKHLILKSENNGKIARQQGDSVEWGKELDSVYLVETDTANIPDKEKYFWSAEKKWLPVTSSGTNSVSADTFKIDNTPLLLNTFKEGNLGGASNIFYSTGASSQPASGSVNQVIGGNSLTANYVPKWDGSKFVNSIASESGTTLSVGGNVAAINDITQTSGVIANTRYALYLQTNTLNPIIFRINRSEKMRIATTGFVGINKTEPIEALDVNGNAIADILKSRVPTGTAPLVVASTTKVDNLNVEMLDGQHGSYYQTASPKIKLTPEGGYAVLLTNKTGANSVKGTVVIADPAADNAFEVNPIDGDMPIGVVYDNGVADGSECWVVVSGIAELLLVNTVASTRSYIAYSSGIVAGRIDIAASVPAADAHFREIGHTLESKAGGTNVLCKCVLHFN